MNNEHETSKRRRGQVARLPKILRDKVNSMLDDGVEYKDIIAELEKSTHPPLPHKVSEDAITRWKEGGYQDYLNAQDWRDRITAQADRFATVASSDGPELLAGGLYTATLRLCQIMDGLSKSDDSDAEKITNASITLTRLSETMLALQDHLESRERSRKTQERLDRREALRNAIYAAEAAQEADGVRTSSSAATSPSPTDVESPQIDPPSTNQNKIGIPEISEMPTTLKQLMKLTASYSPHAPAPPLATASHSTE